MHTNATQKSLNSARLHLEEGRNDAALDVIQTIKTNSEIYNRDVDYLLSWYYILGKKWQKASEKLLPLLSPLQLETIEQEELLERERLAVYLLRLGQAAVLLSHYEDASRHFLYCLKILHDRRIQIPKLRIEAQYNLAMTYKMRGFYALAIRNYDEALRLCRHHELFDPLGDIYYGLSETYRVQGDFPKAHDAARNALQIYQESGNQQLESRIYNVLGVISLLLGDYDASEAYYEKSLALAISNERPMMIMLNEASLAELFLEKEQMPTAKEHAQRALEIAERIDDVYLRGVVYTTLGKIIQSEAYQSDALVRQSKFDEAITFFKKAVDEFEVTQTFLNLVEVYNRLATVLEELGDTKQALAYWKLAYEAKDKAEHTPYVNV